MRKVDYHPSLNKNLNPKGNKMNILEQFIKENNIDISQLELQVFDLFIKKRKGFYLKKENNDKVVTIFFKKYENSDPINCAFVVNEDYSVPFEHLKSVLINIGNIIVQDEHATEPRETHTRS